MRDKNLEDSLRRSLGREAAPKRLDETVGLCRALAQARAAAPAEPRQGFWGFLSDVFRFDGTSILGLQAVTLLLVGLHIRGAAGHPEYIPAYMPLFVLAVMPTFFRGQYHRVSELEAATRSSGPQIVLARLILAGAANLVCMTALLGAEICLCGAFRELGRMILYCLAPYLLCMAAMLHFIRQRKTDSISLCIVTTLGSCVFWRISSHICPWLYEIPAVGVWIAAFIMFTVFFAREIRFIIQANREGKMYGIVD